MHFHLIALFLLAFLTAPGTFAQAIPADGSAAVVLAYQRIGEDQYPGSNLRIEQFAEQINELADGSYTVLPLPEIISALKEGRKLPDRTIAITFEGAYKSLLQNAVPLLNEKNLPFTVFYASSQADGNSQQYMNWNDLKNLRQNKNVTLGLLPAHYSHFFGQDRTALLAGLNQARMREREMLGINSTLFSYPYGEYDPSYRALIAEQGFSAAFGLHSGVAYAGTDLFTLPRFTMTESFGDIERFEMVVNALPLPVDHIEPENPILQDTKPLIGFSIDENLKDQAARLACFISGQTDLRTEIVSDTRIELRLSDPLLEERNRINCTLPVVENGDRRWRWFGMVLMNKLEPEDEIKSHLAQDELP